MKKIQWKDTTSYSRDEARVPRTWSCTIPDPTGDLRITVHRHRDYEPDQWLLSTNDQMFDRHLLKAKGMELARLEALLVIRNRLGRLLDKISLFNSQD